MRHAPSGIFFLLILHASSGESSLVQKCEIRRRNHECHKKPKKKSKKEKKMPLLSLSLSLRRSTVETPATLPVCCLFTAASLASRFSPPECSASESKTFARYPSPAPFPPPFAFYASDSLAHRTVWPPCPARMIYWPWVSSRFLFAGHLLQFLPGFFHPNKKKKRHERTAAAPMVVWDG